MATAVVQESEQLSSFIAKLRANALDVPWIYPGPLIPPKATSVQAGHWRWRDIEPLVLEGAQLMKPGRGAERRIMRLDNPGVPERTATHTISIAIQYLLTGEVAPAHRHTPSAIRFMLRGQNGYTTVEGDRCEMKPGDLVLTPSMTWHDHGNDGTNPAMWIDLLDSPIVRYLENLAGEPYPDERQKAAGAPGVSERRFAHAGLRPAWRGSAAATPHKHHLIHWRWEATRAALDRLATLEPSPYDDVIMEYVDPITGRPVTPALGCYAQLLRPGVRTRAHKETSSAVYYVVEGTGSTTVGSTRFDWGPGDFVVVPPRAPHSHANASSAEPAVLFSVQDIPLLTYLNLYRSEEA